MSVIPALLAALSLATSPEAVVREFHAAQVEGDAQRAAAFLSSGFGTELRRDLREEIQTRCFEPVSLRLRVTHEDESTATVDVIAHVVRTPRFGGAVSEGVEHRTFTLKKENGEWRIASMPLDEDLLVEQLAKATTRDEMRQLVASHAELIGPTLARRMNFHNAASQRALTEKASLIPYDFVQNVAAAIDDKADLAIASASGPITLDETIPLRLAKAKEALRLAKESQDPAAIAHCLVYVSALSFVGGSEKAVQEGEQLLWQGLELRKSIPYHNSSQIQANLGNSLTARGDYAAAYKLLTEGLAEDLAEGGEREAGFKEVVLGQIMEKQNDPQLALEYFQRAEKRNQPKRFVIMALVGQARAYRALGRPEEAKAAAEKAVATGRGTPYKGVTANAFVAKAETQVDSGDMAGAEETLRQALTYAREVSYRNSELESLLGLGNLYYRQGRLADAKRFADETRGMTVGKEFLRTEHYGALMLTARVEQASGNRDRAIEAYRNAIDAIETARTTVAGGDRQQRLFFEPFHAAYAELAGLLFEQGETEQALLYAEQGKSRVLLDMFARERKLAEESLPDDVRQKLAAVVRALGDANKRVVALRASKSTADTALNDAISAQRRAQVALEQLNADIAMRDPALRTVNTSAIIEPEALRSVVTHDDFAILEYVVHKDGVDLVVVRRRGLTHHRIAVDSVSLSRTIDQFTRHLAGRGLDYRKPGRALYDLLLAPAKRELAGKRVLAIVPDGALWRVPFEALLTPGGQYVIEQRSCFYVPSISVYRDMLAHGPHRADTRTLVAFGDPAIAGSRERLGALYRGIDLDPLPEAKREAREIARVWGAGSAVYTGAQAREATAKQELTRSRIVHFAAHGLFDDENPMFSQIVLATEKGSEEDGALQAWELMRLDLHADLVVLSACETARGRIGAGEGLIGMSWALFASGCPSTVAAQWSVSSESTAQLMVAFHRNLAHKHGAFAAAEALRGAQLSVLRQGRTAHPFYWAPFVLIGSPGF